MVRASLVSSLLLLHWGIVSSAAISLSPYLGYTAFGDGAAKKSLLVSGLYAGWAETSGVLEANGDALKIRLSDEASDILQYDGSVFYTRYFAGNRWRARAGGTYFTSNDTFVARGGAFTAGLSFLRGVFGTGLDVHFSHYPMATNSSSLSVWQATPFVSATFGDVVFLITGYFIHPVSVEDAVLRAAFAGKTLLISGEAEARVWLAPFLLSVGAYRGNQMFAVKHAGFAVINSAENYTGGVGASAGMQLSRAFFLKVAVRSDWIANSLRGATYRSTGTLGSLIVTL